MTHPLRHIVIISRMHMRRVLFDRSSAFFLIALPLIIIAMLGIALHPLMSSEFRPAQPFKVVVAPTDADARITHVLASQPALFDVQGIDDATSARGMVLQRLADAALIIPEEFPKEPMTLIATPGTVVVEVLQRLVLRVASEEISMPNNLHAQENDPSGPAERAPWWHTDSFGYYAMAVTAMFAMLAAHTAMVMNARDRASDTFTRLRSLGVAPWTYTVAGAVTSWATGATFIAVLAAATHLLFDVHWGPLGLWAVFTLVAASTMAGLALLIMALVPGVDNAEGVGNALINVLAFFGGAMAPLHVMPEWFQSSLAWIPNRAIFSGYLKIGQQADVATIASEFTTLGAATLILFGLSWIVVAIRTRKGDS